VVRTRGREEGLQLGGVDRAAVVCGGRLDELEHMGVAHDALPLLRAGGAGESGKKDDGAGGHTMGLHVRQQHLHDVRRLHHLQARTTRMKSRHHYEYISAGQLSAAPKF